MMQFMKRRALIVVGATMLAAVTAAAQQERAPADPRTVPELKPEFDRAAKLGLPAHILVSKAREGYLKQASPKVIRDALHNLADRMVRARSALKPVQSDAELEQGALALQQDIPEGVLRNLRQSQKTRSVEIPLSVLTDLVSKGVPRKEAVADVSAMLQRNVGEGRLITFASQVQNDIAGGIAPTVALELSFKGVLSLPSNALPGAAAAAPIKR